MISKSVTIVNKLGLHARPSAKVVQIATRFESEIILTKDRTEVNGKSIMGVMMLAAAAGQEVTVAAEGPDEEKAVEELSELLGSRFDVDT